MRRSWAVPAAVALAAGLLGAAGEAPGDADVPEMWEAGRAYEDDLQILRFVEPAPEEFTAEDEATLVENERMRRAIQERFLNEDLTAAELEYLARRVDALVVTISTLREKRDRWLAHIEGRVASERAEPPVLSAAEITTEFDVNRFYELVTLWIDFYRKEMGFDSAGSGPKASATEWMRLAQKFQEIGRLTVTSHVDGPARYVLRSLLLEARSLLLASTLYYRSGEKDRQLDAYVRGLEILEWIAAGDWGEHEMLPVAPNPYGGCELFGSDDSRFYPRLMQMKTSEKAREQLSMYCPWGLKSFLAMRKLGLTEGLDWRILLPYGDREAQYVSQALLRTNIPSNIVADMERFVEGRFEHFGGSVAIEWQVPPSVTYSVWYISPLVENLGIAQFMDYIGKAATFAAGGPKALLLSIAIDAAAAAIEGEYDSQRGVFAASGTAEDAERYRLSEEIHDMREAAAAGVRAAPDIASFAQTVLDQIERRTMEALFENIDPTDAAAAAQLGNPRTYDGGYMPPVFVRADAIGWEEAPEDEYMRTWHYVRFYQYDARGLTGLERYDLSTSRVRDLPGLSRYIAGDEATAKATWVPLAGRHQAVDARLYVTDLTPKAQVIVLSADAATTRSLSAGLGEDEVLAIVLSGGGSDGWERVIGEITPGEPLDFTYMLLREVLPLDRNILSTMSLRSGYFQKLYKRYRIRFLKCRKEPSQDGWVYTPTDPATAVRGELEVRFAPGPSGETAGRISHELAGLSFPGLVVVDRTLERRETAELDMQVSSEPVLARQMKVTTGIRQPVDGVVTVHANADSYSLKVTVAPVDPGVHHMRVETNGSTFHLYGRVNSLHSAVVFQGMIPAHPGRHEVVLRYGDLAPYTFTVERDRGASSLDQSRASVEWARERYNNATDPEFRSYTAAIYWSQIRWLAVAHHGAGDYSKAMQLLQQALSNASQADRTGTSRAPREWRGVYRNSLRAMRRTAYFLGDAESIADITLHYMAAHADNAHAVNVRLGQGRTPEVLARDIAREYERFVHDAITAGVRGGEAERLIEEYLRWRQRAGSTMLDLERLKFDYGQEMPLR